MTAVQFLCNHSVTCEVNNVKCKTLMQGSWSHKSPNICRKRSKCLPLWGNSLLKSGKFQFWGTVSACTNWGDISHGQVDPCPTCPSAMPDFTWLAATSRPYGGKMLIFSLWVNLMPAVCRFAAILPVITKLCNACFSVW